MGHALPASGPSAGQNDGVVGTDEKCHRQELSPKPPDSQDNVGSKPQDKNSEPKKIRSDTDSLCFRHYG